EANRLQALHHELLATDILRGNRATADQIKGELKGRRERRRECRHGDWILNRDIETTGVGKWGVILAGFRKTICVAARRQTQPADERRFYSGNNAPGGLAQGAGKG